MADGDWSTPEDSATYPAFATSGPRINIGPGPIIKVIGNSGEIDIDASGTYPTIVFWSQDKTQNAAISAIEQGASGVDLYLQSGGWLAPDGVMRAGKLFFEGNLANVVDLAVIDQATGAIHGGSVEPSPTNLILAYRNPGGAFQRIQIDANGITVNGSPLIAGQTANASQIGAAGNISGAVYGAMPGGISHTLTKRGSAVQSGILCSLQTAFYASVAGKAQFAADIFGPAIAQPTLAQLPVPAAFTYTSTSGTVLAQGLPAGVYTIRPMWRVVAAGTINQDGDGWTSFTAQEVAI